MSARNTTVRAPAPRAVATNPVPATPARTSRPDPSRNAATRPAVRRSAQASSGFWCRSRRSATRSAWIALTSADSLGITGFYPAPRDPPDDLQSSA